MFKKFLMSILSIFTIFNMFGLFASKASEIETYINENKVSEEMTSQPSNSFCTPMKQR